MRRIRTGEFDFDGVVDAGDHATFVDCMTGAGEYDGLCHCRFGDIQHDRDVDLADWSILQNNFTASGGPGGGGE